MGSITWVDWLIWLVYFLFIGMILWIYQSHYKTSIYRYFMTGFFLKVFGGLAFVIIHVYYYKYGDTFLYHRGATVLSQTFLDAPLDYFRLLAAGNANLPPDLHEFSNAISYSRGAEEWLMVKLLSPVVFISFHSFLVTTLFMSLIAFWGAWKLYRVFDDLLPAKPLLNFCAAFLLPSVLFYGGGIMRDTLTLAGINLIIYGLYFTVYKRQFSWRKYLLIAAAMYFVFYLKGYVLIAFVPGLLFGLNAVLKGSVGNKLMRQAASLVFLFVSLIILYLGPQFLGATSAKYTTEAITGKVKGFHSWHTDLGGSVYNLGEVEYTPLGLVKKIPAALNVTFFRPYFWESSSLVMLISAIESALLFVFFIYVIVKLRWRLFALIRAEPILITFVLYCLIFGFVVGFTSFNFGALGRYKIPIYSLFVFALVFLHQKIDQKGTEKRLN